MKKLLLISFIFLRITSINAQEEDKVRVGLDVGYVFANDGGALFSIEPKYNITGNSNIGLRFGFAAAISIENESDWNINFLATYDYYFKSENSSTTPFLGVGLGYIALADFDININGDSFFNSGDQFGALIRGGVELGKFKIALEYNIIPKSDLEFGKSIKNSYLGASVGFYLGGGKWKN